MSLHTFVSCSFNVGKCQGVTDSRLTLLDTLANSESRPDDHSSCVHAVFADGSTWDDDCTTVASNACSSSSAWLEIDPMQNDGTQSWI